MTRQIVLLTIVTACLIVNSTVLATDRLVPSQYSTIQAAIDDCNDGDVVIVEPKTYTGPGNRDLDFKGLAITVRSTKPNDPNVVAATVIDSQGSSSDLHRGFYFHSGEDGNSVLDGFTIRNGYATDSDWEGGGGICCIDSSPTITRCVIKENNSGEGAYNTMFPGGDGGGIFFTNSSTILRECIIKNNRTGTGGWYVSGDGGGDSGNGGGIYCISSSLTISGCIISYNQTSQGRDGMYNTESKSGSGGGIYCESSTLEITDSDITNNAVQRGGQAEFGSARTGNGGGIYCKNCPSLNISGCEISSNTTGNGTARRSGYEPPGFGGGIYCASSMITLRDSIINGNTTGHGTRPMLGRGSYGGHGAGMCCTSSSTTTVTNCIISNNVTGRGAGNYEFDGGDGGNGAGIYSSINCPMRLTNCCIINNRTGAGGSVMLTGDGGDGGDGGGVFCLSNFDVTVTIQNCTISGNQTGAGGSGGTNGGSAGSYGAGSGVYGGSSTDITDSIIWGNISDYLSQIHGVGFVYYCDVQGGFAGTGNINLDPRFVSGPMGDYYLSQIAAGQASNSPCVDTGSDTAINLGMNIFTTRMDEFLDKGIVDMGYHYAIHPGSADIDENLHVDCIDYSILAADWRNCNNVNYLPGDITRDTCVNGKDLKVLAECWLDCYVIKATNPVPANEARGVDPNGTLSWMPGEGALYHDVYLGTDDNAVANAGHLSPEFMGTVSKTNFDPCGLDWATMYYWRVDEVGPACMTQGDIWNFTTSGEFNFHLVGYWKFDEGEDSIAYDSAGENDGTIYGAAWTSGQIGGALDFDGVHDYVDIPYDSSLDIDASEGITLSVCIKLNSYPDSTHQGPIFGLYDSTDAGTKNYLALANSIHGNVIGWDQYPPSGGGITSIKPDLHKWYHVAVVQDSSYRAIYINGILDVSDNIPESYQGNTPDTIRIGSRADLAPFYFHGTIDDVMIFDRDLSAEEIGELYQD